MSAEDFYLKAGYTLKNWYTEFDASTTLAIATPNTSMKVVITSLNITNNDAAGTFRLSFGNLAGSKIAEFTVGASAFITPRIGAIACTAYDRSIFGRPSSSATNGWRVFATGFEID